jgi:hypothetical protein
MAVALFSSRNLTRKKFIVIVPLQRLQVTVNDREIHTNTQGTSYLDARSNSCSCLLLRTQQMLSKFLAFLPNFSKSLS